jgi:hypothetical protein
MKMYMAKEVRWTVVSFTIPLPLSQEKKKELCTHWLSGI